MIPAGVAKGNLGAERLESFRLLVGGRGHNGLGLLLGLRSGVRLGGLGLGRLGLGLAVERADLERGLVLFQDPLVVVLPELL